MLKKKLNCPYCNEYSYLLFTGKDYNRKKSSQKYHLYKCSKCSLRFISNPPEDMSKYYQEDYHYIPNDVEELENLIAKPQKFKIDLVSRFKKNGKLLEIGSSTGGFVCLAKNFGFEVTAIEMDENCVNFLKNKLKIKAILSEDPINAVKENNEKFDVICMWHSLEHMKEPWLVLNTVIEYLNKDGILLIAAPNPDCVQIKVMGKYWPHFDLPRHLFGLPINWIVSFTKKNNLNPLMITTQDEGSIFWNRFSWAMLLGKLYPAKKEDFKIWHRGINFLYKILNKEVYFIPVKRPQFWEKCLKLASIFSIFEDVEKKGATYTVIMKKN